MQLIQRMLCPTAEHEERTAVALDLGRMLERIGDRQWALADVDWDAPGADLVSDEQWPLLKDFMADLTWIEQIGARAFAALEVKAPDPQLAAIYRYFHAEEQRHANAELALMRRWGMVGPGDVPKANINVRLAIEWLDCYADRIPFGVLAAAIPMLEVALDGALLKFLVDEVHDPLCGTVFDRVNNDESRHLSVGFHVLDLLGDEPVYRQVADLLRSGLNPVLLVRLLGVLPLLSRECDNMEAMGIDERRLQEALGRFARLGDRSPRTKRGVGYQLLKWYGTVLVDSSHPYHIFGNLLLDLTNFYPRRLIRPVPSWIRQLTYEPVA